MSSPATALDRLATLADEVAADWAASGRARTTAGCERAILRLFGVDGLDRAGRPLAWSVIERHSGQAPQRLAGGIALPFAVALLEYDVEPQELALDVAAGLIDLELEGRLLAEPDRRATAEAEAARLLATALERVDANRTARRELRSLLGDPDPPRLGVLLEVGTAAEARRTGPAAVRAGADVVLVATPSGRELVERLSVAGLEVVRWQPPAAGGAGRTVGEGTGSGEVEPPAPAGSQRGLAALRSALDEVAAGRGGYVRLATSAPALGAPEQAVVAALERVDLVVADPFREIVEEGVDPARALADHAFAQRLVRRSGAQLVVGPGPLLIGPDLAGGRPSDAHARLGRGLALLAVSVGLARRAGLAPTEIVVDVLPPWLDAEPDPIDLALLSLVVARTIFRGHPLALRQPAAAGASGIGPPAGVSSPSRWSSLVAGLLPEATSVELVLVGEAEPSLVAEISASLRTAAGVAAALQASFAERALGAGATEAVRRVAGAGIDYLAALQALGPAAIHEGLSGLGGNGRRRAGGAAAGADPDRLVGFGGDAVAERRGTFDPFALLER